MSFKVSMKLGGKDRKWLEAHFELIHERYNVMTAELDKLTTQVESTKGVMESATVLIQGLSVEVQAIKQELERTGVTSVRLNELADKLDEADNSLAAAVAANTPHPDQTLPGDLPPQRATPKK